MECGTNLFYRLLANGDYIFAAGLFDNQDFRLATEIFIDKKPTYYAELSGKSKKRQPLK
ncbi:hypothetical protein [Maritalea sp.]|jgi:hypothetical protein|uniref:hypothetical protein n=1 Tax=Maritalea sp. TaxID=2003361 RepID=UPI0039E616E8